MNLQISHAIRAGALVEAGEFSVGGLKPDCLCPGCNEPLVAKIGYGINRPHFAHQKEALGGNTLARRCDQRSLSVRMAGYFLRRRIRRHLVAGRALFAESYCPHCFENHSQNILEEVVGLAAGGIFDSVNIIGLVGAPSPRETKPPVLRIIEVSTHRSISGSLRVVGQVTAVPVWLMSAADQAAAASLDDDKARVLVAVMTHEVRCCPSSPVYERPGTTQPAPTRIEPTAASQAEPPAFEPPTFPLPEQEEHFADCLRCRRPMVRRYLFIHDKFRDGFPSRKLALVLYHHQQWLVAGWSALTGIEEQTALAC